MATYAINQTQAGITSQVGDDIDKAARKRGRAYQCLRCYHREGKSFIEVKCRVEAHILRDHLRRDEVPFYWSLCQFRCLKREELDEHVRRYKRHRVVAQQSGVDPIDTSCLKVTNNPYKIGPKDNLVLEKEESYQHWRELLVSRKRIQDPWSQIAGEALRGFDEIDFLDQYECLQEPPAPAGESSQTLVSLNMETLWQTVAPLQRQMNDIIDPDLLHLLGGGTVKKGATEEMKEQEKEQREEEGKEPGKVDASTNNQGTKEPKKLEREGVKEREDTEHGLVYKAESQHGDAQPQEENICRQSKQANAIEFSVFSLVRGWILLVRFKPRR